MKTELSRELVNGSLVSSEEMPAGGCFRASGALQVARFLFAGEQGRFLGIDADENELEVFARRSLQVLKSFDGAVQDQSAKHRTAVVAEHQDDWFAVEIILKPHRLAGVIDEGEIQRDLLVKVLLKANAGEISNTERLRLSGKTTHIEAQ